MEHISLLVMTVGSKELAIGRSCSYDMLIHSDQDISSNDRSGHGDWYISLVSLKSCTEMRIVGSGRNRNDGIGVNPPRTIGSPRPHINRTKHGIFDIFDFVNIFRILFIGSRCGMVQRKLKVKTLEVTASSKMLSAKIILTLKNWAQKICNL